MFTLIFFLLLFVYFKAKIKNLKHEIKRLEHRVRLLEAERSEVVAFQIVQGGNEMANSVTGVLAGQRGSFSAKAMPVGSTIPAGQTPIWASDNPAAVVSNDASDPTGLSIFVDVDAGATGSFNLSVSVTRTDGTPATGSANVPILAPTPVEVSSFDINQTA